MIILIKIRTKVALQEPKAKVAFELAYAPKAKVNFITYANAQGVLILILIQIRTQGQESKDKIY